LNGQKVSTKIPSGLLTIDRILMGAERKSHYVTEESKKMTAYHEGGHALVALHTKGAMPLHKVTIMPRGQALGITFQLPEQDKGEYCHGRKAVAYDRLLYSSRILGND
jgi:ATP-dependent Zn protease